MSFVGKFVFVIIGEHAKPGQIVEQPSSDIVLVKFHCPHCQSTDHPPHTGMEAFPVSALFNRDKENINDWTFFEIRKELDDYLAWLDGDESEEEAAQPASASLN